MLDACQYKADGTSNTPCHNGADCVSGAQQGSYTCDCATGFTGQFCEEGLTASVRTLFTNEVQNAFTR